MIDFKKSVAERFLRYTKFDTMSDPALCGVKRPTTDGQDELLEELAGELRGLGLEVYFGPEHVVMGTLKGNLPSAPVVGFMAHVDTADDVPGNKVKARITHYEGGDIKLEGGTVIKASEHNDLALYVGEDIITSDGTTLLGSDDKAGVAEIMEAINYLIAHPEIKRGDVEVYFTPDEETGSGMSMFPHARLRSKCCYTVDGGREGEVECECFNAATLDIKIEGVSTHLGSGRGKMVNAVTVASAIVSALPQAESPESTDERYGYYCVLNLNGTATEAKMQLFIRDFDSDAFNARIENASALIRSIAAIYHAKVDINVTVSYHNMARANAEVPEALDSIMASGKKLGLNLYEAIIRGGTDGARLAETGVPCPNLFTGGHALHSKEEWVAISAMSKAVNLIIGIVDYWAEKGK